MNYTEVFMVDHAGIGPTISHIPSERSAGVGPASAGSKPTILSVVLTAHLF